MSAPNRVRSGPARKLSRQSGREPGGQVLLEAGSAGVSQYVRVQTGKHPATDRASKANRAEKAVGDFIGFRLTACPAAHLIRYGLPCR
jgi:hypothetical protein